MRENNMFLVREWNSEDKKEQIKVWVTLRRGKQTFVIKSFSEGKLKKEITTIFPHKIRELEKDLRSNGWK